MPGSPALPGLLPREAAMIRRQAEGSDRGRIAVGRFGAPHGVRGEIRVKSYTADPLAIAGYGELQDRTGTRKFRLANARHVKDDMLVVRVAGVTDRAAVEALVNEELFIERAQLPPPEEDEFYLNDLIGLEARLRDGTRYGHIKNVLNFGAGDILEIDTGAAETAMLAFTKPVVPEVHVTERYVIVDPPKEFEGEPSSG
jgi:16S rRNA processing protein RimM